MNMREKTELPPAQAKRQARQKAYYQAHRDEMRRQQREYYQSLDKAAHAARIREYRRKNHEDYLAYRREYRTRNKERFAEYDRRYRGANKEKCNEQSRKYWHEHREELLAKKHEYYLEHHEELLERNRAYNAKHKDELRKKKKERRAAHQETQRQSKKEKTGRSYYERNRYEICKRRIGEECFRAMEKVKAWCPERIERYLEQWPFDGYAHQRIKTQLRWWRIYPQHHLYDDCYDAGMLAYLYSIHRCAMMEYKYVNQYIAKMVRIFITCALNVGREAENLCRENDLRLYRLDHSVYDA